jgi:hypothetical protein
MDAVVTTFWYFKPSELWKTVKPYWFNLPTSALPDPSKITNEESVPVGGITVKNLRATESGKPFSLDDNGFQMEHHDFSSDEDQAFWRGEFSRSQYRFAVESWITEVLGAEKALFLSGSIRRRDATFPMKPYGTGEDNQPIQGVHVGARVHIQSLSTEVLTWQIDFTPNSALRRLEEHFGLAEDGGLANRRYQILK